uniref:Zonadhesin protein n=1 Tax=Nosema pernyi TaxID=1112939 RepID=A0A0N7ADJ4_9MICR|nr:zonadhesin protein [Nosema pernyi]
MKLFLCFKIIVCSLSVNMLKLVNLYRKYYDLEALKPIPKLQMASDLQANTMCKTKRLTHDGIKGRETVRKRAEAFNFIGLNVGENIAKQENDDYKEVFKMWLKSKGHRRNILGNYNYTAVTTCRARDGNRYWVQVFGKGNDDKGNDNKGNDNKGSDNKGNDDKNGQEGIKGDDHQEGSRGNNYQRDGTKGDDDKSNETRNNNQPQENGQPDGEKGGSPNPLTSFIPLKYPNNQTEIQERFLEEEKPPISFETTISISRKYDKPSMVSTSTVRPTNPPLVNQDEESENMEFLFKEGEDTQKLLKKIPQNYHLSFKGNFKKYVAMKNKQSLSSKMKDQQSTMGPDKQPEGKPKPKDESSKSPSMEPGFGQYKPKEKPTTGQKPISKPQRPKDSSPKQQTQIKDKLDKILKPGHPAIPRPQQPKDKPKESKLPDGNQVNGMFKTILDKIKKLEDKKNTEKLPSLTIDLPQIAQPTSAALSSSSLSDIKKTTAQSPSTSTEVIYKTVYKYKDTPESSGKPKESTEKPKESTAKTRLKVLGNLKRAQKNLKKVQKSLKRAQKNLKKALKSTRKVQKSLKKVQKNQIKVQKSLKKVQRNLKKALRNLKKVL